MQSSLQSGSVSNANLTLSEFKSFEAKGLVDRARSRRGDSTRLFHAFLRRFFSMASIID